MLFLKALKQMLDYTAEGVLELFSPNHDDYPAVGEQPFGDSVIYREEDTHFHAASNDRRF